MKSLQEYRVERERTLRAWQVRHRCFIRHKSEWWLHGLLGLIVPGWDTKWWTVIRKPGDGIPTIWVPNSVDYLQYTYTHYRNPSIASILNHELVHVEQQRSWWGVLWTLACMVFPLPVFFSGRWFVERDAYLSDIKTGRRSIDQAVYTLWGKYGMPWPKGRMRAWFEAKLEEG